MEDKLDKLHKMIKEIFSEAVIVRIAVTEDGIEVTPEYRTNTKNYSMRNICGNWIKKDVS